MAIKMVDLQREHLKTHVSCLYPSIKIFSGFHKGLIQFFRKVVLCDE